MTTFSDQIFQLGGLPVGSGGIPPGGNHYYMWPSHADASDGNSGAYEDPVASFEAGYALLTANQHDCLHYVAGSSSDNLEAAVTWSKNYTHFVGHAAPTALATRARLFQLSTLTGASPLLTISATGCIFANFYIFQGVADATSLINVSVTGGRNYFYRVHFAGGGHATQAINGGASLKLDTDSAEENLFEQCTIGVDTIDAATGMVALLMDGEAHRNVFRECILRLRAGNSGAAFVEVADATGIDRDTTFIDCLFINNSTANDMDAAFLIPEMGEPRLILLKDCIFHNVTKLDANDRGVLFGNMNAITGADLSGVAAELVSA
jgi:hypothetical protein